MYLIYRKGNLGGVEMVVIRNFSSPDFLHTIKMGYHMLTESEGMYQVQSVPQ